MTNVRRHELPGQIEHIVARGVHGDHLARRGGWDTELYNAIAREAVERDWRVWSLCVMETHYHLLVETSDCSIAAGLHRAHSTHASRRNRLGSRRRGAVFGRRYSSFPIRDGEHLRNAIAYVARNPVAAGVCVDAGDWPCSTYRAIAGLDVCPPWVAKHDVLSAIGRPFGEPATELTYRLLVGAEAGTPVPPLGPHDWNRYDVECLVDRGHSNVEIAGLLRMSERQVRRLAAPRRLILRRA